VSQGSSPIVHPGSTPNRITGGCRELAGGATRLVLSVNGQVLTYVVDTHGGGPIAWHGALVAHRSPASPNTVVRFTDYRAYDAG